MKKFNLLFFCIFLLGEINAQTSVTGTWQGKLAVSATSLRLVIHIAEEGTGFSATLDSPDQGAKGIPVSRVERKGDSLWLEIAAAGAKLSGRLTSDTTFSGQWSQGVTLPLELKKSPEGATLAGPRRPQTPRPPFPYASTDVVYYNKEKTIQYGGTITKPNGNGPFPALLLLTGSGQQNRDEEIFGHKPFAVIADDLTRKGYLVLRVDDRGVGQTTGEVKTTTTRDFAGDALVSLDYLKSLPEVDKSKLGLLGHSEGGMIAQMVAAQRNDIAFVVLLAAPGEKVIDLMTDQNRAVLQSAGVPATSIEPYLALYRPLALTITTAATEEAINTAALQLINNWLAKTPKEIVLATTGIRYEASKQAFLNEFKKTVNTPWFRYFLRYNPDEYVRKIKAKVLAINGGSDIQVIAKPNLSALKTSLQKSKSKNFTVVELPGLNHLFQHCTKCTIAEYGELEETIAPEALETIGNWLDKNVK